ncbi:MAG: hypothetical protein J1E32_05955 [Treponema sp.]|nr:hypothetical protein [Treponema sp.]
MAEIYDCVIALRKLLNVEYECTVARKGSVVTIRLGFEKRHFYHLMGLQYIRDVRQLDAKSAVICAGGESPKSVSPPPLSIRA